MYPSEVTKINGGYVLGRSVTSHEEDVVLVWMPHGVQQFVTAIVRHNDSSPTEWYWGHYFFDILSAATDFETRGLRRP